MLYKLGRGRKSLPSIFPFSTHSPPSLHLSLPPPVPSTYWLLDSPVSMATEDSQLPCPHVAEPRGRGGEMPVVVASQGIPTLVGRMC